MSLESRNQQNQRTENKGGMYFIKDTGLLLIVKDTKLKENRAVNSLI